MAKEKATTFSVEARKVTTTVGQTGTADTTEDTYVLGATIDGQFVPFLTKNAGYIDHLVSNAKAASEADTADTADDAAA